MLSIEHSFWDRDPGLVLAGVDEVGRGPLAGPVYASAVAIAPADADSFLEGPLAGLTDSYAVQLFHEIYMPPVGLMVH